MPAREFYILEKSEEFCIDHCEEKDVGLRMESCCDLHAAIVAGRVTSCGKPVPDAVVKVFTDKFCPVDHTLTNCEGKYAFVYSLKPGCYKIAATADGYEVSKAADLVLRGCEEKAVNFELRKEACGKPGVLYGQVFDCRDHSPIEGVLIYLFDKEMLCVAAQAMSNSCGQYLFSDLKPGRYEIRAYKQWYELKEPCMVTVQPCGYTKADLIMEKVSCEYRNTVSGLICCDGHPLCGALAAKADKCRRVIPFL